MDDGMREPWTIVPSACDGPAGLTRVPDLGVDVTITDPPYSAKTHEAQRRGHIGHEKGKGRAAFSRSIDLGFDALTPGLRAVVAGELARITRRWVLVFTDAEGTRGWIDALEGAGLEHVRVGCWVKVGSTPQFTGDRPASGHEEIVIAHRPGKKRWNGGGQHAVWSVPIALDRGGKGRRLHTTQKPLALMETLVRLFSDPGELIADPFAGSGTTGVAAVRLGRRFVGWERQEKYAAAASKRLEATRYQPELFAEKAPRRREKQADLFAAEKGKAKCD